MKKILIVFILIAVLFTSHYLYSAMKDFSAFDGYNWLQYHEYVKVGLALGFLMGAHKTMEELGGQGEEALPVYNVTNTQLKEELDKFYDIPENRSVTIENACLLILKKMSPEKDIEMIKKEEKILRLPPEEQRVERIKEIIKEDIKTGRYPKYEIEEEEVIEKETGKPVPLETEEEVTKLRFEMLAPGVVITREVVKISYLPGVIIGVIALIVIVVLIGVIRKKGKVKKGEK